LFGLLERVNAFGFLFFIAVWHIAVYCPIAHMMWTPKGWFAENEHIEDFSGGLVVHMLGGLTATCVHVFMGTETLQTPSAVVHTRPVLNATCAVWLLWVLFSAGKAYSAGPVAAQSVVNFIAATAASVLSSFFYMLIMEANITPISVSTAIMIGMVSITPASGYVTVGGAMVIAIVSYVVTITFANFILLEGRSVNAALSVTTIHTVAGTTGFLMTAMLSYKFINPQGLDGATWGNGKPILYHFILTLLFLACTTAANFLVLVVCDEILPLRATANHNAEYPDFSMITEEMSGPESLAVSSGVTSIGSIGPDGHMVTAASANSSALLQQQASLRRMKSGAAGASSSAVLGSNSNSSSLGGLGSSASWQATQGYRASAMKDLELTQSGSMQ
jgi:ammonium transporter, Amt family